MKIRFLLFSILFSFQLQSQISLGLEFQSRKVNGFNWFSSEGSYINPLNLQYIPSINFNYTKNKYDFGFSVGLISTNTQFHQIAYYGWYDVGPAGGGMSSITTNTYTSTVKSSYLSNYFFFKRRFTKSNKFYFKLKFGFDQKLKFIEKDFLYEHKNVYHYNAPNGSGQESYSTLTQSSNNNEFIGLYSKDLVFNGSINFGYETKISNQFSIGCDLGLGIVGKQYDFYKNKNDYGDEFYNYSPFQLNFNLGVIFRMKK
jgi:hypothetical protein